MNGTPKDLFDAFSEDHAILGRGFHELSTCLRSNDLAAARSMAERLDREAAAHIAFEEEHFYPALVPVLGEAEVARMLAEHARGLSVVRALLALDEGEGLSDTEHTVLLDNSEAMELHIAECGELFEAMGRLTAEEQLALLERLEELRTQKVSWQDYAGSG